MTNDVQKAITKTHLEHFVLGELKMGEIGKLLPIGVLTISHIIFKSNCFICVKSGLYQEKV